MKIFYFVIGMMFATNSAWAQVTRVSGNVDIWWPNDIRPSDAVFLTFKGEAAKALYDHMTHLKTPKYHSDLEVYAIDGERLWCHYYETGQFRSATKYECGNSFYATGQFWPTRPVMIGVVD